MVGVFNSPALAEKAREELAASGIDESSIALSADLTSDGIAAEAPGESYENQPGQRPSLPHDGGWFAWLVGDQALQVREAQEGDAVRSGSCTMSVDVQSSKEARRAHLVMRHHGARSIYEQHSL